MGRQRGQTEVLGIVLLFALVLMVSTTVVVIGTQSLDGARESTQTADASISFSEFQSAVAASSGTASAQSNRTITFAEIQSNGGDAASGASVEGGGDGTISVSESAGAINISVDGTSIVDTDLGRVEYDTGDETIAYQNGGVFRKNADSESSTVESAPQFAYRTGAGLPTLSFPITKISTSGNSVGGTEITIKGKNSIDVMSGRDNRISEDETIHITVESKYYKAWASLFAEQMDATVEIGDFRSTGTANQTRLIIQGDHSVDHSGPVSGAITSAGGISVSNNGDIHSYDPSDASHIPPSFIQNDSGHVSVQGDTTINNNPHIAGKLLIDGDLGASNNWVVERRTVIGGDANWDNNPTLKGGLTVNGDMNAGGGSMTIGDDFIVGGQLESIEADEVDGSIYAHNTITNTYEKFQVDPVHGSIESGGSVRLETRGGGNKLDLTINENLVAANSVWISDNVEFTSSPASEIHAGQDVTVSGDTEADIIAGNDVTIQSGVTVTGDVHAGNDVENHGTVTGHIEADNDITGTGTAGSETQNGSPDSPDAPSLEPATPPDISEVDPKSDEVISDMASIDDPANNDNGAINVANIENGGCSPCTIGPGKYSLDRINPGGTLAIHTNDDPVKIYVDGGEYNLDDDIEIYGDGRVEIAVDGGDLSIGNNPDVDIVDNPYNSTQHWIYLQPTAQATTSGGSPKIVGVLHGTGSSGSATYSFSNNMDWYGAIIGDTNSISSNPTIHFDETLLTDGGGGGGGGGGTTDSVGYLQITSNEVEVEDSE